MLARDQNSCMRNNKVFISPNTFYHNICTHVLTAKSPSHLATNLQFDIRIIDASNVVENSNVASVSY
jgi:hypothetical protein